MTEAEIEALARAVRRDVIRMVAAAGSGHPGGSLSAADILAVLYSVVMRVDPARPDDPDRDRFILSKGHAAPALYAVLAERGYFAPSELLELRRVNSRLQGHPDMRKIPGVDASTGSLGQGLAIAAGLALAARVTGRDYQVYTLLGDGETAEGMVWEAAMAAAHYRLDNLTAIVDVNGLQIDGRTADVMNPAPLDAKWEAFGWQVVETDGHDPGALLAALAVAMRTRGGPTVILAHTVKGKGVSFMENRAEWHGKAPNAEQTALALAELEGGAA
ncbi:MAG: transketolase [Gracilibacteraceae bacterium]|nr:transketolase [Gracilibacteraceae bacterium]